jgi:hypothetical protein
MAENDGAFQILMSAGSGERKRSVSVSSRQRIEPCGGMKDRGARVRGNEPIPPQISQRLNVLDG